MSISPNTFVMRGGLLIPTSTQFDYNAVQSKGRRQSPSQRVKSEGRVLTPRKRSRLQATAQDQARNHSLAQWMINKHISYVSDFNTSIRTNNTELDELLIRIMKWHGAPKNFDIAGRLGRSEAFGLFERTKVTMGDAAFITLDDLKMQAIESDLIRKARDYKGKAEITDDGLVVAKYGKTLKYCICNRGEHGTLYSFDHLEEAANVIFDGYYTRFGSQFRGISPLASAINTIQDIVEAVEYNMIKAKMHALFGVAIMRNSDTGDVGPSGGANHETDSDAPSDAEDFNLSFTGPNIFDLQQSENIKTIESTTPSEEFVEGTYLFIQLAMLALDIPVTFFDSRRSSFSASLRDQNEYEVSCRSKRRKNKYARQDYSNWLIKSIYYNKESPFQLFQVAQSAGKSLRYCQEAIEWIAAGTPWVDQAKQVKGEVISITARIDNPINAARRRGSDAFKNVDKTLELEAYEQKQRAAKNLPERAETFSVDEAIKRTVTAQLEAQADSEEDDDVSGDKPKDGAE